MAKGLKGKVGSKFSSAAKHADMLGAVVGYLGTFAAVGKAEGVGIVQEVMYRHINAVSIHNVANLETQFIPSLATTEWGGLLKMGVGGMIGGVVLGALPSLVPWQGSLGSILKKGGFGLIVGAALATAVGKLAEGSGGGTELGGQSSGSGSSGGISTTGMKQGVLGSFAPPAPYAGAWARPS